MELIEQINQLTKLKVSLLIKQDDFDKEKIKVRLFCPSTPAYNDVSLYRWELTEERLINEIAFNLIQIKEKINEKKKLNDIKKSRSEAISRKPF